jgi:hypothetical protein
MSGGVDGRTMKKLDRSLFLKELKATFPQLRRDLNQEHGLLHLETDVFMRFVQTSIDTGAKDTLVAALQLADKFLRDGNGQVVNALTVSFLEHLNFEDGKVPRRWAWLSRQGGTKPVSFLGSS